MDREARGSSPPLRMKSQRYGAVRADTPLNRDLTFEYVAASEQRYCSLPSRAAGDSGGAGGFAQLLRRVVVGGVVITLFAAAVSTLYGGRASSEPGVRGELYPEMAAEVSIERCGFPRCVRVDCPF